MKSIRSIVLGIVLSLSLCHAAYGQNETNRFGVGATVGSTLGLTGQDENLSAWGMRALFRYALRSQVYLEAGGAYLNYSDKSVEREFPDVRSSQVMLDARAMVTPWSENIASPYGFAGVGYTSYQLLIPPGTPSGAEATQSSLVGLLGLGLNLDLSPFVALDATIGSDFPFSDDFDTVTAPWLTGHVGLVFTFGETRRPDADRDRLVDEVERKLKTDPKDPDSDDDSLSDYDEVMVYRSNPHRMDTDNDGLLDAEEALRYGSDLRLADGDGDGLSDLGEARQHLTDPGEADTDNDGLLDGDEITVHRTDPNAYDTDNDGLDDGAEVTRVKSGPNNGDTDHDGIGDGDEVVRGRDPLRADGLAGGIADGVGDEIVVEAEERYGFEMLVFEGITATPARSADEELGEMLELLERRPAICAEIEGHADDAATPDENLLLSRRRAEAVRSWLIDRGIDPVRLTATGYGSDRPVSAVDGGPAGDIQLRVVPCP